MISIGNQIIDRGAQGKDRIGQHHAGEDQDRDSHGKQQLFVAHVRFDVPEDVFDETRRRGQQGGRGTGLDRRNQGTEEEDLNEEWHVIEDHRRQDFLRIVFEELLGMLGHFDQCRDDNEHRNERKNQVAQPSDDRPVFCRPLILGRHDPLEDILLGDRA